MFEKAFYKPNPNNICQFDFTGLGYKCLSKSTIQVLHATYKEPDGNLPIREVKDGSIDRMVADPAQPGQTEWIGIVYELCGKHVGEWQKNHMAKWAILQGHPNYLDVAGFEKL